MRLCATQNVSFKAHRLLAHNANVLLANRKIMEELLKLIKDFEKIAGRDYWLVAYTDGTIEIHNDHKAIICTTSIEEAKKQLIERM